MWLSARLRRNSAATALNACGVVFELAVRAGRIAPGT
jgi:hypothetical protein